MNSTSNPILISKPNYSTKESAKIGYNQDKFYNKPMLPKCFGCKIYWSTKKTI